jgi:hypothetical protein
MAKIVQNHNYGVVYGGFHLSRKPIKLLGGAGGFEYLFPTMKNTLA